MIKEINETNPLRIFESWFDEAKNSTEVRDHTEMVLATSDGSNVPEARVLLLKKFDERGFCFFTNYEGGKAKALAANPKAAICIYWNPLEKQIRIQGDVEKLPAVESDEYFASRPRGSQIGALSSKQSQELSSRQKMLDEISEAEKKYNFGHVPRPSNWGGYLLRPKVIEFWQAGEFRIHHRVVFSRAENEIKQDISKANWIKKLLYP